jgi:hypothetical protein
MVVIHLKTEVKNYKIPPMGPMIYMLYRTGGDSKENAKIMLDFALERLDILESSKDYISVLEYTDLKDFISNCKGYIIREKDTDEYFYILNIMCSSNYRFEELLETHEFINDIPVEPIEIGDHQTIYLYFNDHRITARDCITDILYYLDSNPIENESDTIIKNHIKTYLKYIIDNEIFSKHDLLTYTILEKYI